MEKKEIWILVCPGCFKPYRPAKTLGNAFGIFAIGFKCKYCGYAGAGPIKLNEKAYKAAVARTKKSGKRRKSSGRSA